MFGLSKVTITCLNKTFLSNKKIETAIVYGSRAKGYFKPGSDIDITLKGNNIVFNDLINIYKMIDELNLPYKVDINIYNKIKEPSLIEHINRVGQTFFEK